MRKDQRKSQRRPVRYAAWLALAPSDLRECALSDISNTGARIDIENSDTLPNEFALWLASNGSAQRNCRVVWRTSTQIGVRFEGRLASGERAALAPYTPI
ncbi:PilZ domain-containing protein [Microbacteriaceae bacterium K1510]|nr:PilZ domain-containing protein [Microbacteriaceae bacterium K1510]